MDSLKVATRFALRQGVLWRLLRHWALGLGLLWLCDSLLRSNLEECRDQVQHSNQQGTTKGGRIPGQGDWKQRRHGEVLQALRLLEPDGSAWDFWDQLVLLRFVVMKLDLRVVLFLKRVHFNITQQKKAACQCLYWVLVRWRDRNRCNRCCQMLPVYGEWFYLPFPRSQHQDLRRQFGHS